MVVQSSKQSQGQWVTFTNACMCLDYGLHNLLHIVGNFYNKKYYNRLDRCCVLGHIHIVNEDWTQLLYNTSYYPTAIDVQPHLGNFRTP